MATLASGKLSEMFEDFLKTVEDRSGTSVYRSEISQLISSEGKSLVVDFGDLLKYNSDLANRILLEPDSSLASFRIAAFETMRSENALYADRVKRELTVRLRGLTDLVPLRKVDTSHIDHMIAISGMVVRTSELRPMMTEGAWVCPSGHLTYQEQDDLVLKRPPKCELCGEIRNFELDRRHSRFIDFQVVRVQELPEELPPGQLPQFFDVNMEGDIVNTARPGDRVVMTGVLRAVPDYSVGQVKTRLFRSQIDCNHVEVKGKEPGQVLVTREDEELIKKIAASPDAYDRLVNSIAPVILGHQAEKEAILLLLAGGSATVLPDGTKLRGDINALFVGDPGCLVADERVVLGNGAIFKIGQLGQHHLQPVNFQVLTGEGGGKRDWATTFHHYRKQLVIEVITESGKSIKGTPNHPLLRQRNEEGRLVREWCRLDNFKVGDRVVTVTGFPCTITEHVKTGFAPIERSRFGPKFKGRLPESMTPDLAAFCGYVLGDGWVDKDKYGMGFVVSDSEVDLLPKLLDFARDLFGLELKPTTRIRTDRRVPMHYVYLSNEDVVTNLRFLREKRVPDLILASGNEVVATFLAWLFEADGTVFGKGRGARAIGLKAEEIELLRDVQMLLLRFGIHSRIVGNALLIRRGEDIVKFARKIGFVSNKKRTILALLGKEAGRFARFHRQRTEKIVKIVSHNAEDVYDIEVPQGHRFIANGVVSHNTGKSELLKFASQVAPRGLYASGRGTTAAGLSAAVIREKNVLMLEAGVVVLADLGIAAIDEFEKMKPEDRTALHEMMEQQTVTIAKGGIYATLNARTAILAACNPVLGRYNPFQNLTENIGTLPIPLLSVGPDEQILLRQDGTVQSRRIGEFVDSFYSTDEEGYPMHVENMGLEVASTDADFKVKWQPLKYVFRHKSTLEMLRISFKGRDLILTGGHSVYTFENGSMILKPASELRVGDHIVIAKRLPQQGNHKRSYNILESISPTGYYLHGLRSETLQRLGVKPYEIRARRLRAERFRELPSRELRDATLSARGSGFYISVFISAGASLFRLLGYFVAEGSMVHDELEGVYAVDFSLDWNKDQNLVKDISTISRELFGVEPTVRRDRNSVKVDIRSKVVVEFLVKTFGLKSGAKEKRIPDAVFNAPDYLKWEFVNAYYAGDAGVTTSKELAAQLLQVFGQLGHLASIFKTDPHEAVIEGRHVRAAESYLVPMPTTRPQSNEGLSYPPLSEVIPVLKPLLGGFAPVKSARRALTPKYWEELRNAIWVRNKISKLSEVGARPDSVGNLAKRFGITEGACSEFISKMVESGMVQKIDNGRGPGHQGLCLLTDEGAKTLATVGYLDRVVAGDLGFVKVTKVEKLEPSDSPQFVYDLSVPDSENFIADTAVCHNTRFDIIFVFRDQPSPAEDERLASHILAVHARRSYTTPPPIEFSLLKKYLTYAKRVSPNLTKGAMDRLRDFYLELRRTGGAEDSIPPTPRTLEALIRIATARARVLLRDEVTEEDALSAIALMNRMVEDVLTDATTKKTDFGIQLGKPVGETKNLRAAMEVLKSLEGTEKKPVERKLFKEELIKAKFSDEDAEKMIRTMFREGMVYESKPGFIRRLGS